MADVLAKYRGAAAAETASAGVRAYELPARSGETYEAFRASEAPLIRCTIWRAKAARRSGQYAYLMDIAADPRGNNFFLLYSHMAVKVQGRNLLPIVAVLDQNRALFIEEYNADKWGPEPANDNEAPLIRSIEITLADSDPVDGKKRD